MTVLTIRGLGKSFGSTRALAALDLDVPQGSRTAVVGPSGSGKTTLLRLIAGFEAPDTGEIALDGQPIATAGAGVPPHRRNIGLVMQEGALFPHLSVAENIRFGIRDEADGKARALALMDLVELDRAMADRGPHQLSGGQQQRVALARALARRPRLMLLDEPFSALDTGLRDQLRRATADILSRAGIATLLVTHDREEAMSFADQLVVLRDGRLAQAGAPRALYLAPADEAVAAFLGPAIVLDAEVRGNLASTRLGTVPLLPAQLPADGPGRVLLRPEQLRLSATNEADASGSLRDLSIAGSMALVTLELGADRFELSFETPAVDLPDTGTPVRVAISGTCHLLA